MTDLERAAAIVDCAYMFLETGRCPVCHNEGYVQGVPMYGEAPEDATIICPVCRGAGAKYEQEYHRVMSERRATATLLPATHVRTQSAA